MTPHDAAFVFGLFEQADDFEALMWRVDMSGEARDVRLFALCNDLFSWATADCEEITEADFLLLEVTLTDLLAVDAGYELGHLFAARKRKMRPQKPCYKGMEEAVVPLYDACCSDEERAGLDRRDEAFWLGVGARARRGEQA